MSKSTISIYQLFELIPDAETARVYLEKILWPDGVTCPDCKSRDRNAGALCVVIGGSMNIWAKVASQHQR